MSQSTKFHLDEKYPFIKGVRRHGLGYAWFRADKKYKSIFAISPGKPRVAINIDEVKRAIAKHDVTHVACRSDNIEAIVPVGDLLNYINRNPQKIQASTDGPFALLSVVDLNSITYKPGKTKSKASVDDELPF